MKVGTIIHFNPKEDMRAKWMRYLSYGFDNFQLSIASDDLTAENAARIRDYESELGFTITAVIGSWWSVGNSEWNFTAGPQTLGIVPVDFRAVRIEILIRYAAFAKQIGCDDVATHLGFIPENPSTDAYISFLHSLKYMLRKFEALDANLLCETGQETPVTLLRTIQDTGSSRIFLNYDPANLLMYGKANPVDGLDIVGQYVKGVHGKDGCYPTDGHNLGIETPLGKGRVNFPLFLQKLHEKGYDGAITIEREIEGDAQLQDVLSAKQMLEDIIASL
jgi:sugar phosphate isomerase/epimerase